MAISLDLATLDYALAISLTAYNLTAVYNGSIEEQNYVYKPHDTASTGQALRRQQNQPIRHLHPLHLSVIYERFTEVGRRSYNTLNERPMNIPKNNNYKNNK